MEEIKLVIRIGLILSLLVAMIFLVRLNNALKLERRFNKYTVEPLNNNSKPFFEILYQVYVRIRNNLTVSLNRVKIFGSYSKKYEKYLDGSKKLRDDPMNYIAAKILCSFAILALIILSDIFQGQNQPLSFLQMLLALLIGFFLPDAFLISKKALMRRQLENDLLQAIIIMNNAFKSGRSTIQAISIVSTELTGPISDEFKKMYIDLSFGLSLEVVFSRFAKRVNIEEAKMMTASLTILNRTGGNIVKVFSSIERSFFNRRKLQEELRSLTASSRTIFIILIAMPIVMISLICLFNSAYFNPLFTSIMGRFILASIILIYVSYILVVRRVMGMGGDR